MNRRMWILAVIVPLISSWGLDRLSKMWASDLIGIHWTGPIAFVLHHNHGALLGLFSELPPILRVVSLATGGAFILVAFFIIQYLLTVQSYPLRMGMSLLMGGIFGNVTDRLLTGYVIDFLVLGTRESHTPVFNIADAIQWIGYGMIVYAIIKEGRNIWPDNSLRKSYWVNVRFQLGYCLKLMGFGVAFSIIGGIYSYTYFKVTLAEVSGHNEIIMNRFLGPYLLTFAIITSGFLVILFFVGLVLSHRSAGPIYAFEKFLEDLFAGRQRHLRLRAGDEFRHLEDLATRLNKKEIIIRDRVQALTEQSPEATPTEPLTLNDEIVVLPMGKSNRPFVSSGSAAS